MDKQSYVDKIAKLACSICEYDATDSNKKWTCMHEANDNQPCSISIDTANMIYDEIVKPLLQEKTKQYSVKKTVVEELIDDIPKVDIYVENVYCSTEMVGNAKTIAETLCKLGYRKRSHRSKT